jgi:hypothetical protein
MAGAAAALLLLGLDLAALDLAALTLATVTAASWLGMNYTGSTPFTSPSGVEKEMRRAMPFQALAGLAAIALFLAGPLLS